MHEDNPIKMSFLFLRNSFYLNILYVVDSVLWRCNNRTKQEQYLIYIMKLTFYNEGVECGFPSPARDYTEGSIDLNKKLILNPNATFIVKARGKSMTGVGIYPGDLIIVDRSIKPTNGTIVVAVLDGELSIKILQIKRNEVTLLSANNDYSSAHVSEEMDLIIWGVCIHSIHKLYKK